MVEGLNWRLATDKRPKFVTMKVGKNDVDKLKSMDDARQIRAQHVAKLRHVLEEGGTFTGVFYINKKKDDRCAGGWRMIVIDGNHRLNAMKQFLEANPDKTVTIDCLTWEELSREEEDGLFLTLSDVQKIRGKDKFQVLQRHSIFLKLIKEDKNFPVPVGIYNSKEAAGISSLMIAYLSRNVPGQAHSTDWVEASLGLDKNDFDAVKGWMQDMATAFGVPTKGNHWWGQTPLIAVAKVYFTNTDQMDRAEVTKRLSKKVATNNTLKQDLPNRKAGGSLLLLAIEIVALANSGYSDPKKLFKLPPGHPRNGGGEDEPPTGPQPEQADAPSS